MNRVSIGVLATLVVILIGTGLLAYVLRDRGAPNMNPPSKQPALTADAPAPSPGDEPLLAELFGSHTTGLAPSSLANWESTAARIALRFSLAAFLAGLLAFRWRRGLSVSRRNPFVAQTQILMAVVAAAMMMVVGDSAARAFGIFAAASLVRFRTNIRDPKEITVLLMSLAIGLACGVGKIEVAIILSLFSLLVLSVLKYYEPQEIFRAMELTVTTRKVEESNQILRNLFERRNMITELRRVDREDEENPMGKVVYYVNVNGHLSTDQLSDEIFSSDPENVDSIHWDQKKTSSYVYR